jgi:hypothetical protein
MEEGSEQSIWMKCSKNVNLQTTAFQTSVKAYEVKKRTASSSPQEWFEDEWETKGWRLLRFRSRL